MRRWTAEERKRQAQLIRDWQPWKKAGVKTPEGKAISCMNAYKHGGRDAEVRAMLNYFAHCRRMLREI